MRLFKYNLLLLVSALLVFPLQGCESDDSAKEILSVSKESISVGSGPGSSTVGITANISWEISCPDEWVTLSPLSGSGSLAVDVEYDANPSVESRSTVIAVKGSNKTELTVNLTQEGVALVFSANVDKLEFPAKNNTAKSFTLTTDKNFTLDYTAGWMEITGSDGKPLLSGTPAQSPLTISVKPISNISGAERTAEIILTPSVGETSITIPVVQSGEQFLTGTKGFPVTWWINSGGQALTANFATYGYVPAYNGSAAAYTYIRSAENQKKAFVKYVVESSTANTFVTTGGDGDYWLFSVPVETLPAGNAIDILFQIEAGSTAPKYFVTEYLDNKEWKTAGELKTAAEDSNIKYTFRTYSNGDVPVKVSETFAFTQSFTNENINIRVRQVGNIRTGNGGALDVTSTSSLSSSGVAKQSVSLGPQIRYFGGAIPAESKKVLVIGNSYTYYNASYSLLKEIAWHEGIYIKPVVFTHGSYTIAMSLANAVCMDMVDNGGFDYAIVQIGSTEYGIVGTADDSGITQNVQSMMTAIRAKSPSCKTVLELTWAQKNAYAGYSYEWFKSYSAWHAKNVENITPVATASNSWVSPIGVAWDYVRTDRPSLELYASDGTHPSYAGSYLKSCVNYLTLFGRPFGNNPHNGELDAATAAYLRGVAESVVLGHESSYNITR
jgi:hypothetical protein